MDKTESTVRLMLTAIEAPVGRMARYRIFWSWCPHIFVTEGLLTSIESPSII